MSRLRFRTWTQRERLVMKIARTYTVSAQILYGALREEFLAAVGDVLEQAEKIKRTKGCDPATILDPMHRHEVECPQVYARWVDYILRETIADQCVIRREPSGYWGPPYRCWVEHPDNPNILVRRAD